MTTHITSYLETNWFSRKKIPQFPPGYLQVTIFKVQQISQTSHPSWHSPCSSRSRWSAEPNSCTDICSVIRTRQNPSFPFSISAGQLISLFYGCIHTCAKSRDILCERCGILSWSIKEGYSSPQKELQTFIFSPFLATVFGFNLVAKNRGIFPISSNLALRHLSVVRAAVQDLQIFNKFQRCNSCRPAPKTWRLPSPHYCSPSTSPSEYLSRRFWVLFQEGKKLKQKSKTAKSVFHLWALPSTSSSARWTRQVAAQNVECLKFQYYMLFDIHHMFSTCSPQSCCQSLRILPQNVCLLGFPLGSPNMEQAEGSPRPAQSPKGSQEIFVSARLLGLEPSALIANAGRSTLQRTERRHFKQSCAHLSCGICGILVKNHDAHAIVWNRRISTNNSVNALNFWSSTHLREQIEKCGNPWASYHPIAKLNQMPFGKYTFQMTTIMGNQL